MSTNGRAAGLNPPISVEFQNPSLDMQGDQNYGSIPAPAKKEQQNGGVVQRDADEDAFVEVSYAKGLFALFGGTLFVLLFLAFTGTSSHGSREMVRSASLATSSSAFDDQRFYYHQRVDHFDRSNRATYAQRYFEDSSFFGGPGYPIFVVMGGEDAVEGIVYPWISRSLAEKFGALTICIEHRFYGASQPIDPALVTNSDFRHYLHPRQALADASYLIRKIQQAVGCGPRGSSDYCPVLTVGGSYSGFLSVLMRTIHSDVVDMAWGSSAPLMLYSHSVSDDAYYDKLTEVAEKYSPGCAAAVKATLTEFQEDLLSSEKDVHEVAQEIGLCKDSLPAYIDKLAVLQQEVIMIVASHFAENNMEFYPPTEDMEMVQGCRKFQQTNRSTFQRISDFLRMRKGFENCFDVVTELPPGVYGTISASDWSGVGGGHSGYIWDYQSCTLIQECSLSPESMFPPRKFTLEWLTNHCQRRFGYTPHLDSLVEEFGFDNLSRDSYILFTNGANDGWVTASITHNISDTIVTYNFPNGAHHSDLTHTGATDQDTPDIVEGHEKISALIGKWLKSFGGAKQ